MKKLLVYDSTGFIFTELDGDYKIPTGLPYIEVEVPEGKRIKKVDGIGVDTSITPHEVILEDIPPTETDILKKQIADLQYTLMMNGVI